MTIVLDGQETLRSSAYGGTGCDRWMAYYWAQILPPGMWAADLGEDIIVFNDKTTRIHKWGILVNIVQTSTVRNPVKIKEVTY